MLAKIKSHPLFGFALKTLFYFVVLMLLVYLYGYFGVGQASFIYNEF